eukprot:CAMPEP_0185252522 /NCGR_PEP_ID=MMETSP1359-20130426/1582_1 /TAXON_ID=552665 /ORGANISM="Bigelowiella longifila, Strain CCMP242" /LENGTH=242 /DNA_ID=CAMNT_0027834699 /DNA_START=57 /DNA_END=782 /DNA_ORIENTATION=-
MYSSFPSSRQRSSNIFAWACVLSVVVMAGMFLLRAEAGAPLQRGATGIRTTRGAGIRTVPSFGGISALRRGCSDVNHRYLGLSAAFELPPLPWEKESLAPHMSSETVDYHYGKHHAAYINKLNDLVKGTEKESKSLIELIMSEKGGVFNSAAQAYNHEFFWKCLSPNGGGEPIGAIAEAINRDFGSYEEFKKAYDAKAVGHFGSGWVWLVKDKDGKLSIIDTHDAENPLTQGLTPILTTDVW